MSENYIIIVCMHVLSTELCGIVPVLGLLLRDGFSWGYCCQLKTFVGEVETIACSRVTRQVFKELKNEIDQLECDVQPLALKPLSSWGCEDA